RGAQPQGQAPGGAERQGPAAPELQRLGRGGRGSGAPADGGPGRGDGRGRGRAGPRGAAADRRGAAAAPGGRIHRLRDGRMKIHRLARVAEAVREVASETILFELRDPRVKSAGVTVTRAEVSGDLQHAKV